MNQMMAAMREENGELRGLTGAGKPGLYTLLGGTATDGGADSTLFTGGAGQVSSTSRLAAVYKDTRLAAVAAGRAVPAPGGSPVRGGGDTGGRNPVQIR